MLGHELTHIRNGDVRMLVIAVIIAGAISFFAELVFRLMFHGGLRFGRGGDRKGGAAGVAILIAIALIAVAWVLSLVIRFALSRSRELLADAGSVELTKNPDAMISALRKIEGRGELRGRDLGGHGDVRRQSARGVLAISSPPTRRSSSASQAIIKFAGGHDPGPLALPEPGAPELAAGDAQQAALPVPGATPPRRRRRPADRCRPSCGHRGRARPATAIPLPMIRAPGGRTAAIDQASVSGRQPPHLPTPARGSCFWVARVAG